MILPDYDGWKLDTPPRFEETKMTEEPRLTTEELIDAKFRSLTKAQRIAFRLLCHALATGIDAADYYTASKSPKANRISEPCSVGAMELIDFCPPLKDAKHDNLVNGMFDRNGVLDQTLMFILTKTEEL